MQRKNALKVSTATLTAGALGLTACGGGDGDADTLRVAALATDRAAVERVVEMFEEANDGATVDVTYADTDQYQSTIRTQLGSGTAPDVLQVYPGTGNPVTPEVLADSEHLLDLSDRPWVEELDVPDSLREQGQVDGSTYMMPLTLTGIGAIYNLDELESLGQDIPDTWDGVLDLCTVAQENDQVAFALGNLTPWVTQIITYGLIATTVYPDEPDFDQQLLDGDASFAESGWENAFSLYMEMEEHGCFQDSPNGTDVDTAREMIVGGDALAVVLPTNSLGQIQDSSPDGRFMAAPLPATNNPEETLIPGAAGAGMGVNAAADNEELAIEFVDFLMEEEVRNEWATISGSLPAVPDEDGEIDEALSMLSEYQAADRLAPFPDQYWPSPEIQDEHFNVVQDLFNGSITVEESLERLDTEFEQHSE